MPLQATSGAASQDGFGGNGVPIIPNYIEEVFSTYLYTGNSSTQTITNDIDLSTKGGLVWLKSRTAGRSHSLFDTARGASLTLTSNENIAQSGLNGLTAFNSNGFSLGSAPQTNFSAESLVSWSFRKQPKFFDLQTWVGDGSAGRTILHNLGSVPACIIVKAATGSVVNWAVYHRGANGGVTPEQYAASLNTTAAFAVNLAWNNTAPTATDFTVGAVTTVNRSGSTYVAYIFAHNAGGFGLTGTDNVISCGSYTTDGSGNATVNLGYEPQWFLRKKTNGTDNWRIADNMRGWTTLGVSGDGSGNQQVLFPNLSNAEATASTVEGITSTGFGCLGLGTGNETFIYIAIRRGPMKVPTTGTSVFSPIAYVGANGAAQNISAGFPVDMDIIKIRNDGTRNPLNHSRLMGGVFLATNTTGAQQSYSDNIVSFNNAQNVIGLPVTGGGTNEINGASSSTYVAWALRRAPSYMDVVCYSGTGASNTVSHNLQAVPELMIVKPRSTTGFWRVYSATLGNAQGLSLNGTDAAYGAGTSWDTTTPTSTFFKVNATATNTSGTTYVAYLFATCTNVSKVGSYTGNGTTQTIDCGLTAGARFVLIKRTDNVSDWYVYDTARGMTTLTDPYLLLNTTAAEAATLGSVTTVSTGFALNSTILAAINVNAGTYIFLAIA